MSCDPNCICKLISETLFFLSPEGIKAFGIFNLFHLSASE